MDRATDDLLLECASNTTDNRVRIQIKHNFLISERSETFKEVVAAAWSDYTDPALFNQETDKIYIIKSALTISEKNHLKQLFNWPNSKATANDFVNEVNRIKDKKSYLDLFKTIINSINPLVTDEELFKLLKRFDVLEYDFGNVTSIAKTSFLSLIDPTKTIDNHSSTDIWNSIFTFISDSDPKGSYFTNANIPAAFSSY
ncbi:MAG: hypothetical protein ACXVBI_01605 [Flavisolibacter sp.]